MLKVYCLPIVFSYFMFVIGKIPPEHFQMVNKTSCLKTKYIGNNAKVSGVKECECEYSVVLF